MLAHPYESLKLYENAPDCTIYCAYYYTKIFLGWAQPLSLGYPTNWEGDTLIIPYPLIQSLLIN